MDQRYKVIGRSAPLEVKDEYEEVHHEFAQEMMTEYGLHPHFTEEYVIRQWERYSDLSCAGWLISSKEEIERVFGVILEKV